jgi:pilus assembly protein CpaE
MTTVAVITGDPKTRTLADQPPTDTTVVIESPITSEMAVSDRSSWLASLPADVVVFGPDIESEVMVESAVFLRTARPEVNCIAVHEPTTDFLAAAMTAGMRDVIAPSSDHSELREAIRLLEEAAAIRSSTHAAPRPELGTVVTILGPKGGVGKTTVAINLAYALAMRASGEVVLVDLDLAGGDVADSLGIEAAANVGSVVGSGVIDDPTSLKLSLTSHTSGALVLPAPTSLVEASKVEAAGVTALVDQLTRMFRIIVLDTGPGTSDATVSAVRAANDILAVTTPEIGGVRTLERHLDGYDAVGFQRARRHVLLNKEDRRNSMTREDVETLLRRRIDFALPYDRNLPAPANEGIPYLQARPRGPITNTFAALAAAVQGGGVPTSVGHDSKGWFR